MLTKKQLRSSATADLERLHARIAEELESRIDPELEQKRKQQREGKDTKDKLFYSGQKGHYQWEYVECGHKERCKRCQSGKKHGPYLYRYFYRDGKQKSEYIKLSDLAKHPDAPARPA